MTSKWIMIVIIAGFCATLMGAAPANAPTSDETKARLAAEYKDLSQQYQTEALKKENAELKMERIAKRAGEVQEALRALEVKKGEKGKEGKGKK